MRQSAESGGGPATRHLSTLASWPLAVVLGSLVLTALLYWPSSLEIAGLWEDTVRRRYTHGWLVLAITVWLVWRDRAALRSVTLRPPGGGWLLVALGSVAWLIGFNAGLLAVTTLVLPLLVLATIWAAGGWVLARRATLAVLYLYFALPVWELVNPVLQWLTALMDLWLTRLAGIPVTMDDKVIHIPAGSFEIAGGCSGLHFFIVAVAIATLQGEVDRDDLRTRWLLIGIAAALAMLTNWLRVFIIIVAGHLSNMQHFLVKVDHYYFGWFLFVFALALYFFVSTRVPRRGASVAALSAQTPAAVRGRVIATTVLPVASLALGPLWALAEPGSDPRLASPRPPVIEGWSGPDLYLGDWRPAFANPDAEFLSAYRSDTAGDVALYQAVYYSQRQGKELRGYGNSVAAAAAPVASTRTRDLPADGRRPAVKEFHTRDEYGRERLIWSLFSVGGRPDPMGLRSQIEYGLRSLVHPPTAAAVALASDCRPDCEAARRALEALALGAVPALLQSQARDATREIAGHDADDTTAQDR